MRWSRSTERSSVVATGTDVTLPTEPPPPAVALTRGAAARARSVLVEARAMIRGQSLLSGGATSARSLLCGHGERTPGARAKETHER